MLRITNTSTGMRELRKLGRHRRLKIIRIYLKVKRHLSKHAEVKAYRQQVKIYNFKDFEFKIRASERLVA